MKNSALLLTLFLFSPTSVIAQTDTATGSIKASVKITRPIPSCAIGGNAMIPLGERTPPSTGAATALVNPPATDADRVTSAASASRETQSWGDFSVTAHNLPDIDVSITFPPHLLRSGCTGTSSECGLPFTGSWAWSDTLTNPTYYPISGTSQRVVTGADVGETRTRYYRVWGSYPAGSVLEQGINEASVTVTATCLPV
ncbi:MAG: hypothetical protein OXG94_09790 [Bacteroidetes bacterium]|nr:hypothetical protein [Bacteroidota bacterium]